MHGRKFGVALPLHFVFGLFKAFDHPEPSSSRLMAVSIACPIFLKVRS